MKLNDIARDMRKFICRYDVGRKALKKASDYVIPVAVLQFVAVLLSYAAPFRFVFGSLGRSIAYYALILEILLLFAKQDYRNLAKTLMLLAGSRVLAVVLIFERWGYISEVNVGKIIVYCILVYFLTKEADKRKYDIPKEQFVDEE